MPKTLSRFAASRHVLRTLPATALAALLLISVVARAAPPPPPVPLDKVLASNSRTSVTYADFEAELARIPAGDQLEFLMSRERLAKLLENVLINKTLALEAREHKLDQLPKVQAEIRNQADKVLAKYRGLQVQNEAPKLDYMVHARETYLADPARTTVPEQHTVWHLLVSNKGRTVEQTRARIDDIRRRLLAGESPESLAQTLSDDPSAQRNNGNLGTVDLIKFDTRFAAAVRKLKLGEVSQPFETNFGLHIAKLTGYVPSKRYTFEEVKFNLADDAETQHLRSVWSEYLQRIQNDPKLSVDTAALDAIRPKLPEIPPLPATAPAPAAADAAKAGAAK